MILLESLTIPLTIYEVRKLMVDKMDNDPKRINDQMPQSTGTEEHLEYTNQKEKCKTNQLDAVVGDKQDQLKQWWLINTLKETRKTTIKL